MPIGIQRLNAKTSQPNPHIVFIKPLKGRDEKTAQDFLERIAAQCLPVMRKHHIHVMSLEEFPPNREFVGRNFNAGEVIQLVLKAPGSGRWLPFHYVQMVMMHELAHCAQMNHSRAFWAVRNQYAAQMQALWAQGYKGDGLWGRGATLGTGEWERNSVRADELLPEHLCGGTYRSRGRKRKRKPVVLTYQERKERRILNKFGKNGVALGADEAEKVKLEKGRRVLAKPRVAGSLRGRELRAAAALARFEQSKGDDDARKEEEEEDEEEDTKKWGEDDASDYEEEEEEEGAVDVDGSRMVDRHGGDMVKVCEDEDADDADARNELHQLHGLFGRRKNKADPDGESSSGKRQSHHEQVVKREEAGLSIKPEAAEDDHSLIRLSSIPPAVTLPNDSAIKPDPDQDAVDKSDPTTTTTTSSTFSGAPSTAHAPAAEAEAEVETKAEAEASSLLTCPMCSFANSRAAVTCAMCANVLSPTLTPGWRCKSAACTGTAYVNAKDCGVCGLCGQRRG